MEESTSVQVECSQFPRLGNSSKWIQIPHSSDLAVSVKDAKFSYGRRNKNAVLQETNLRIPKSVIYALLGPSGCGKTTLLKALSNLIKVDNGEILVFGKKPGSQESTIPGSGLGYMPQEVALYDKLTIEEAIYLFGKLHSVNLTIINQRLASLVKLLKLHNKSKLIGDLSGGQKRRVSLACAMINNPKLLVLDEPTVGVDPLLRKAIWSLMVGLTQSEGTTIIITTHYIDEAKEANIVGMMRGGRILRESNPYDLMEEYNAPTLEQCFIEIIKTDKDPLLYKPEAKSIGSKKISIPLRKKHQNPSTSENASATEASLGRDVDIFGMDKKISLGSEEIIKRPTSFQDSVTKIKALFWRNLILLRRNILLLLFQLGLPGMQVSFFCIFVGATPFDLPVALVNDERPKLMSTLFLDKIDTSTINQRFISNFSEAIGTVENGENLGVLHIPGNFTKCLLKRMQLGLKVDNYTIDCSSVKAHMDVTNYILSTTLTKSFFGSYEKFMKEALYLAGSSEMVARPNVDFTETIYSDLDQNYTAYILPNAILCLAYCMSIMLTAFTFIHERKSGIFDRFLITGVTLNQILVSQIFIQSLVVFVQGIGFIVVPVLVFGYKIEGSVVLFFLLTVLQGFIGMTFGLFISALTSKEDFAINMMNSVMYPLTFLGGFLWPIESLPPALRIISKCLSLTIPSDAMRSIFSRGWGLENKTIILGFVVSFVWILIHIILIVIIFKLKK